MSDNEERDISKRIECMERKVDRVLRAIEGDDTMGADGLARQVRSNRESIDGMFKKIQGQDKKIATWAGFMGACGAFIGAIATGIVKGLFN